MLCCELEIIPVLPSKTHAMVEPAGGTSILTAIVFSHFEVLFSCNRCRDLGGIQKCPKRHEPTSESIVETQVSGQGSFGV